MVRVGVTGATGFVGGALVPALAGRGHELVLIDNRTGPIRVEYPRWPADSLDFGSVEGLRRLSECDVVLHLGAVSGVMACAKDPIATAKVNVGGTRALVEMCRERHIPLAFASSLAVVGSPERLPVTEETRPRPTHEYARQKAEGERLVLGLGASGGVRAAVLRMSNVYGNYLANGKIVAKGNVLTLFLDQARSGALRVNAPGTQRRDFVHIGDTVAHWVAVVDWLARAPASADARVFHVAGGEGLSVLELAEKVRTAWSGAHPSAPALRIEVVPNPRAGVELVDPGFAVSRERTERELGISCGHRVEDFLREAVARRPDS